MSTNQALPDTTEPSEQPPDIVLDDVIYDYYFNNLTQSQIAKKHSVSRQAIGRRLMSKTTGRKIQAVAAKLHENVAIPLSTLKEVQVLESIKASKIPDAKKTKSLRDLQEYRRLEQDLSTANIALIHRIDIPEDLRPLLKGLYGQGVDEV